MGEVEKLGITKMSRPVVELSKLVMSKEDTLQRDTH